MPKSVLTLSGTPILDADRDIARTWGISQQGGQVDTSVTPSGIFIGRAATNRFVNGQNDATTNVTCDAGVTVTVDTGSVLSFSPNSLKCVTDGTAANQRVYSSSGSGQGVAAGVFGVGSLRFKGTAGQQYDLFLAWVNTDATGTSGAIVTFTATGSEQLLGDAIGGVATLAALAVAAGKTGNILRVIVGVHGTRADTFWIGRQMLESGQSVVAPYVATSGGVTATKATARVQAPASLLSAAQGWVAMRLRAGWAANAAPGSFLTMFDWRQDSNNKLQFYYNVASKYFTMTRWSGGSNAGASTAVQAFNAGDALTVVGKWDGGAVYVSVNGGPFVSVANAYIPAITATLFDIGQSSGSGHIDSAVLWFACGTGTLTDADAGRLASSPNNAPPKNYIVNTAQVTGHFPQWGIPRLADPVVIAA